MLEVPRLVADMNNLAAQTWDKIADGDAWGLKFREDSLTDHSLFALARAHPGLIVDKHNANREKSTGADWEWWVGGPRTGWVVLRIQAKRLHGHSYTQLHHEGELPGERQYDTLMRACAGLPGHFPIHVLYSGWNAGGAPTWPPTARWRACPAGRRAGACGHATVRDFGCAVAGTPSVAALAGSGTRLQYDASAHLSQALPWSYLFAVPAGLATSGRVPRRHPRSPRLAAGGPAPLLQPSADSFMDQFESLLGRICRPALFTADDGPDDAYPPDRPDGDTGDGWLLLPGSDADTVPGRGRARALPSHLREMLVRRGRPDLADGPEQDGLPDGANRLPAARLTVVAPIEEE